MHKMKETKCWEDCQRDDLRNIPLMESLGYITVFNYKDKRYDRTNPLNPPHDPVSFENGNYVIWKCMQRNSAGDLIYGWQTAYLREGIYTEHKWFPIIEEAIKRIEK